MNIYRIIFIILLASLTLLSGKENIYAQNNASASDIKNIKVDQLSDQQIEAFVVKANQSGLSPQAAIQQARLRGMPAVEADKLLSRINKLKVVTNKQSGVQKERMRNDNKETNDDLWGTITAKTTDKPEGEIKKPEEKVFGFQIFNTKNLTFEPSMNIATPKNYQVGPGDEMIIDIWGASEATYNQKISPDGSITIPNLGPVYLNGLSIDEANNRIKKDLSKIYAGLRGPNANTFCKVSIGELRSIKVSITGEAYMPGTYTLPSLSTAFNAIYTAGGISFNGSYRNIKVIRDNKSIAEIDLYDFLLKGEQKNNIRLQDQDVIFISTIQKRTELTGEVKRPGYYEMKENENLQQLLYFAGGFTENAYKKQINLVRKTDRELKNIDVEDAFYASFIVQNGDSIFVSRILDRYENRIEIKGAVYRPGKYALSKDIKLSDLLSRAEGLKGDAYKARAVIYRQRGDLSTEIIPINLNDSSSLSIILQREDVVNIPSIFDLQENFTLRIEGEVKNPGSYPFTYNTRIADLITQAGGLLESASRSNIEIARRIKNSDAEKSSSEMAQVFHFNIDENLQISSNAASFYLEPFDVIFIRRSPGYESQKIVKIEGEINFPGTYSILNKDESLYDLIQRAGGLTDDAYPNGAKLIRKLSASDYERIKTLKKLSAKSTDSIELDLSIEKEQAIGIRLDEILKDKNSPYNMLLEEGDVIRIPKELQTVRVGGAVLYPVSVQYKKKMGARRYVNRAGGFNENARKSKTYVIYANGAVDKTSNYLLFYKYPKIEPGAEIVVPVKPEKEKMSTQEVLAISTTITSLTLVIITLVNQFK